jgi:3-hydroxyisobutyrate dehydrogenase
MSSTVFESSQTDDITFVEHICWQMLSDAAKDRKHPMHTVVIGTSAGALAQMRTVVLRRVDLDTRKLYFHTDIRSAKIDQIRATGQLSWLAYDPSRRSQIRLSGSTILHHGDELAQLHWSLTQHPSRRCYLLPEGPGRPLMQDVGIESGQLSDFSYSKEESEAGFDRFVVVETQVDSMEWYYTYSKGNRRALFSYIHGQLADQSWLTP